MTKLRLFIIGTLLIVLGKPTFAQDVENEYQTRTFVELSYKPIKKVKLSVIPELRFDESFTLDKWLIEGEASYKPIKLLTLGAAYRFVGNTRENKDTEYLSRFGLSATVKKDLGRFTPAFRLSYTNYSDDDLDDETFLRYKGSVKYNIPKCKFTPYVSGEIYQQIENSDLYKIRYGVGGQYKIFKNNYLQAGYKFDYFMEEYKNKHILQLGYKIKF